MFDGAQHNTRCLYFRHSCFIISISVVVLPVPGGPWIIASSFCRNVNSMADICDLSSLLLKNSSSELNWFCDGSL